MFRLLAGVRRGNASNLPEVWHQYPTLEQARIAARVLLRHERVTRITVVRNAVPPAFIEFVDR